MISINGHALRVLVITVVWSTLLFNSVQKLAIYLHRQVDEMRSSPENKAVYTVLLVFIIVVAKCLKNNLQRTDRTNPGNNLKFVTRFSSEAEIVLLKTKGKKVPCKDVFVAHLTDKNG